MKKIILLITVILGISNYHYVGNEINIFNEIVKIEKKEKVLETYYGEITAYGPDCKGCIGITASGYNVKKTIYYNDKEYGKIRILAADRKLPFGTIVRIKELNILGIVLDRGSAIGFSKRAYFDLLNPSEKEINKFGRKKATFEILRLGY